MYIAVYPGYIVIKARAANLMMAGNWTFDRVDVDAHPEYLKGSYWKDADFTLFVWCPFDVTMGGLAQNGDGKMTFPDFYSSEHSSDGMLWSFLSREGTKLFRAQNQLKSSYYKGFIERNRNPANHGPINYNTGFETSVDWSCETGILAGHHPHAIYNLQQYYPIFANGDFKNMVKYIRNIPAELDNFLN